MSLILVSSDLGDTWTLGFADTVDPLDLLRAGDTGPLFVLRDSSGEGSAAKAILRSNDGQNWSAFTDPLAAAGVDGLPAGLAYDITKDELYLSYQDHGLVFALVKASQVIAAQVNGALAGTSPASILLEGVPGYWKRLPAISGSSPARGPRNIVRERPEPP